MKFDGLILKEIGKLFLNITRQSLKLMTNFCHFLCGMEKTGNVKVTEDKYSVQEMKERGYHDVRQTAFVL